MLEDPPPTTRRWLRAFWVSILVAHAVVFAVGLNRVGVEDHDQMLVFHEIQHWNQQFFGLDRQWTPVMGGGMSAAGDPQIPVLSPAALAGYAIGPFWGMRIVSILWFAVGFGAAFLYAGLWLRKREARLLAAALFIGNGFFVCRFAYGHLPFLPFMGFPLLLWALHRAEPWARAAEGGRRAMRRTLGVLALGGFLALQVDGSAQSLVYMLPWVGIYAFGMALARRSPAPVLLFVGAVAVAGLLDAAFLWSLVDSQQINQRLRPGQFTNPLALLVFLVAPFRGHVDPMPTPQNGYEISVFVGIVVAWALVRYGRGLLARMPREVRTPLLLTSVAAVLFGMGSLAAVGVPKFLSPYDWLRELPGFRSIVVTCRFWGFLALPLSLMGGAALWRFACAQRSPQALTVVMLTAFGMQLGFQAGTIAPKLLRGRTYEPVATAGLFEREGEQVAYKYIAEDEFQGEYITPVTGVINCFNLIDFIRPEMAEGSELVSQVHVAGARVAAPFAAWRFRTWSQIEIVFLDGAPSLAPDAGETRIVLRQAWHPYWTSSTGRIEKHEKGNLTVTASRDALATGPVVLTFHDRISALGTRVSAIAWPAALALMLLLGLGCARARDPVSSTAATEPRELNT